MWGRLSSLPFFEAAEETASRNHAAWPFSYKKHAGMTISGFHAWL
jgi:hypothetical protein